MTFEELVEFLDHTMSMSHIYQPLLIRALVDAEGTATLRQLAHAFLGQDESQLVFYQKRIKEMPLKVLTSHGVVQREGDLVSLMTKPLSFEQKAKLRLRITLVIRTVLHTHWDAETWPLAKKQLRTAVALKARLARAAAWWN